MTPTDLTLFALAVLGLWARCIQYNRDTEAMAQQGIIAREDK